MNPIPIILDGDPGHDDAMAWMLAQSSPLLDIRAVTSSCGNQTIEKTTYNALRVMTLLGIDAPMAKGRSGPLVAKTMNAPTVHGESGLDGPALPEPAVSPQSMTAVELMAKVLSESAERVTLVPTGPLTNVAALLLSHPELKPNIERISLMGGGIAHGNWTPAAEFNILVDPEAADLVFRSGVPITMAGLDVTEQALIFPGDFERIRAVGNDVALVVAEWLEFFYRFHAGALHRRGDACVRGGRRRLLPGHDSGRPLPRHRRHAQRPGFDGCGPGRLRPAPGGRGEDLLCPCGAAALPPVPPW